MKFEDLKTAVNIMETLIVDCIVFFLVLALIYSMYNSDMQKREWCYAYIRYDACFCQNNPDVLINKSLIVNPYEPASIISEDRIKEIAENIKK